MPNIKSAKKRVRIAKENNMRNKSYRSALRTTLKKADAAIASNSADKDACVKAAVVKLDQAVTKGILHKNTAARKKSRLVLRASKA